jgi:hypothetical protein
MAKLIDAINAKQKMSDAIKADIDTAKTVAVTKANNLEKIKGYIRASVIDSKTKTAGKQ